MITILAAYDVTVSSWLLHAFSSMVSDPFYALVILCVVTVALFLIFGKLWGLAWNKKWVFSGNRFLTVGLISLIGGLSLAAVNGLYGGKFFQTEVVDAMEAIQQSGAVLYDDIKDPDMGYTAARPMLDKVQLQAVESDEERIELEKGNPIIVTVDDKVVAPYFTALRILWTLFWCVLASLIIGVAWFAYKDIKVKEKYNF
ncbi:MAG: hypothetical protein E7031_01035 [Akkermansiaceae bacterium]|nr:hypothetical protein [Akkermansiaceae bacterium]